MLKKKGAMTHKFQLRRLYGVSKRTIFESACCANGIVTMSIFDFLLQENSLEI